MERKSTISPNGRARRDAPTNHTRLRGLAIASMATTFLLVAIGGLVRATNSGLGCSGWPKCTPGRWLPPLEYHAIIEYSHRLTAFLDVLLIGLLAAVAWRRYRGSPRIGRPAMASVGLVFVQAALGGIVVKGDLAALLVTAHFATAMVLAVSILYMAAMAVAAAVSGAGWRPLAVRFVHSLVPIAFAYLVAHYFSLLLLEGQQGIALASDPFGTGWNLFGTAGWHINYGLLSAFAVWYIQVAAIVGGHVGGVILAHDRAIASFPPASALRTQYALLAVMVLFTVGGLLIQSGG